VFKFLHQTLSHLLRAVPAAAEITLRHYLFAAQIADSTGFPNQTYDFLEQAFSIYEDQITDSKSQYSCLMGIANALELTRSIDEEQFNTLALRTAQFGGKLLRRVDQARAIVSASHLWWSIDSPYLPESEEKPVSPFPTPTTLVIVLMDFSCITMTNEFWNVFKKLCESLMHQSWIHQPVFPCSSRS
jgi:vacuolar protein sorting-associated protein 35